jgi:hypothetical protein
MDSSERPKIALTDHQHEGNARRLILEVDHASDGQHDRWVLVHVLQRRLPLEASWLRAAISHAQARGWLEFDGRRVRLLDNGHALIGGHQRHQRSSLPERPKHQRRVLRRRRHAQVMPMKRHW